VQKFLKFQLDRDDLALLAAESVKEAISLTADEILPVPQVLDYIIGVYNWRGEIIWTIDLPRFLGYPISDLKTIAATIVQDRGRTFALVVPAVNEIIERDLSLLQHNIEELFPQPRSFYLQGYFAEPDATCLCAIDLKAIIAEMISC
jgi:positive phototaxis protein PixI